jgi:hypothetical protein
MKKLIFTLAFGFLILNVFTVIALAEDIITFEGIMPGTILSQVFGDEGSGPVAVNGGLPDCAENAAVVFDSSNPTGGDDDLGTPNETCDGGGPGSGIGGEVGSPFENCDPLGNVLIVHERCEDLGGTSVANPDDADEVGAALNFDFSALGSVTISEITIMDVEAVEPAATVELFDGSGDPLGLFILPQTGDNGVAIQSLGPTSGVVKMKITLNGSGAIDNIIFTPDEDEEVSCRVTAGGPKDGVFCPTLANGEPDPEFCEVDEMSNEITHTWGGQAGAPPRIDGNWTHKYLDKLSKPHNKFTFHSNDLFFIQCSDPGEFCQPARFAPARQIDFSGIGRFTNTGGVFKAAPDGDLCFNVHLEDIGEPGPGGRWPNATDPCTHCPGTAIEEPDCTNCRDFYSITIYSNSDRNSDTGECLGQVIWHNGNLFNCAAPGDYVAPFAPYEGFFPKAGNVQIHPDNNGP